MSRKPSRTVWLSDCKTGRNRPGIPDSGCDTWRFHQEILENMIQPFTTCGNFSREVRLSDGGVRLHQFSWVTGIIYNGAAGKYRNHFLEDLPAWVDQLHPVLASRLSGCALKFGRTLPDEQELSASTREGGDSIPKHEDLLRWADQYRVASRWLDLRLSCALRQLLGADLLPAILSALTDGNVVRRDRVIAGFRRLYEIDPPFHEPASRWAHEQLGGWFRKDIERALGKTLPRWPFRHPENALEAYA